jgi:hypothetical protein
MSWFIDRYGGNASTNQSGLGSLDRALAAGVTLDQIRASGVNFGPAAANKIDMLSNSFVGQYGGNLNTNQAGLASVNRALASGMSIAEIQNKKVDWGPDAKDFLFPRNEQADRYIQKFGGIEETGQAGLGSLDRGLQAGLTYDEIAAMGINFGPKASEVLSRGAGSGFIGKYGGDIDLNSTGLTSVLRAQRDGMSTKDIAALNLNFGPKALEYLQKANAPKPKPPSMYKPTYMAIGESGNAGGVRPNIAKSKRDGVTGYSRSKMKKTGSSTANPVMSILGLNI